MSEYHFRGDSDTGHNVTKASGGNHHCDGTNNGANPLPGPTRASASDGASKLPSNLFTFDGYVQLFYAAKDDG